MRLRLDNAGLVPSLLAYLGDRADVVVEPLAEREVAVGVLGSFADGGRQELERYLAPWLLAHPGAGIEFVQDEAAEIPSVEELADALLRRLDQAERLGDESSLGIA
jgi:hypothetical protein